MTRERLIRVSERWFRLLLHLYPRDFRDEVGLDMVDAFNDRVQTTVTRHGAAGLMWVCLRALVDSLRNGVGERIRPAASWRRGGTWGRDLELARRRLVRSKLFAITTLGTLTIGLGGFAVVYTAVDRVLIEPLPYREPNNLYVVWRDRSAASGLTREWLAGPDVAELQNAGGPIEGAAAMQLAGPTLSTRRDGEPMQIVLMTASPNLFDVLGVAPMLGRDFAPSEVGPSRPSIVILSHAIWKRLGGDPSIVGSQVWMSGSPYTVIGVMGPNFRFVHHSTIGPPQEPDVYTTLRFHIADQDPNTTSFATLYGALIRIRSGVSPAQAAAAVDAAARAVNERKRPKVPVRLYPVSLPADLVAPVRPVLIALGVAGLVLLLVLTVNFASLLLARVAQREREFAVSRALGANRSAVVRAMVFEGALLGVVGGAAGALLGSWGVRTLVALAPPDLPRRDEIALDWRIAVVVVVTGLVVGAVAAALPSLWAARVSLAALIAPSAVRGSGGSQRMRRGVIVAQVALTLVMLCAGGLVARSFERLLAADPGFRPAGVLTFAVAMGPRLFPKEPDAFTFQERVERALAALPGVRSVSATTALPLSGAAGLATISIPGAPGNTGDAQRDAVVVDVISTRARYAELMGMRVLAGRTFEPAHRADVREVLIDRHLAAQFFPTGTPLGASIPLDHHSNVIVGVVDQARLYNLHQDGRPQIFVRAEDWTPYVPYFTVKTDGDPEALVPGVRRLIREIDPRIPVSSVRTMEQIVDDALRQPRISTVLMSGFALGALLLVAMGLFGLIAGSIANRHGEIAVRLALGASHSRVLRLIVEEGAMLVGIGMLIAVPGIYAAGGFIRSLLVDVTPWDPITLLVVAFGLALVTMTACYVPARRVLSLDPSRLLRQQ